MDPRVARYWKEHYDIGEKLSREWPSTGRHLRGKIRVVVGTADTFHLDESARVLERRLLALGAQATFTYVPGKTHFDLFSEGEDPFALVKKIARQMYETARPARARGAAPDN